MATLYELTGDFIALWDKVSGILPEDETEAAAVYAALYQEAVEDLQFDIGDKLQGYVHIIKRFEGELATAKKEKARVEAICKSIESKVERLKTAVLDAMITLDVEQITTQNLHKVRVAPSPRSVFIADGVKFAPEYLKAPKPPEVDKRKLLQAIDDGEFEEDDEVYVTQGRHLRIT